MTTQEKPIQGISEMEFRQAVTAFLAAKAKPRYLGALWRGELIGCQLFSEPGAGSDLANVSTKAVRDADEWVVNGQKVWTSGAHYSDLGLLLGRTSRDSDNRHHGLTMFLVDMHSPGIDIRPLR